MELRENCTLCPKRNAQQAQEAITKLGIDFVAKGCKLNPGVLIMNAVMPPAGSPTGFNAIGTCAKD